MAPPPKPLAPVGPETKLRDLGLREATAHALYSNGCAVLGDLLDPAHTRAVVAGWPSIGASRLADLDAALARAGLAYGKPASNVGSYGWCADCKLCPECGNPRATDRRAVVVGLDGRASHVGHRVGPTCHRCDAHHRALFTTAAAR
jgi:hypothetical protein